jgi:hypothetical protein
MAIVRQIEKFKAFAVENASVMKQPGITRGK